MSKNPPIVRRAFLGRTVLGMTGAAALGHSVNAYGFTPQASSTPNAAGVKVEKDVVVGKGGDTDLHCDIYRPPAGTEKRMALVHFHGGGFARAQQGHARRPGDAHHRSRLRLHSGAISATAASRSGLRKSMTPKTQIRWVRAHAGSLGIDPKRIAIVGHSAGGHIALFTAGQPDAELAACVAFYPQTDIKNVAQALMPPGSDEAAINDASPIAHIKEGYPPTVFATVCRTSPSLRRIASICCRCFATSKFRPSCTPSRAFRTNSTSIPNLPSPAPRSPISFWSVRFYIREPTRRSRPVAAADAPRPRDRNLPPFLSPSQVDRQRASFTYC